MLRRNTQPIKILVADIGSREAKALIPFRPDLSECSSCGQHVWVDRDYLPRVLKSGLAILCRACVPF